MNRHLALLLALLLACLAGCAATGPNTAALHLGMTKDEAIAVMGPPDSVAANGNDEFLNYAVTVTSPDGYRSMMRPYYVRLFEGRVQSFGYSEQISRRLPPPGQAAENAARFAALRVGMTKEETIKTLGAPASVAAQGDYEYLNYSIADASPYNTSAILRPYTVRLVGGKVDAFGLANQVARPPAPPPPALHDDLQVVSIDPATLIPGKSQHVIVRVKYSVATRAKAVVALLFNLTEATRFKSVQENEISGGTGEIALETTITPVDWAQAGPFKVGLHLLEYPHLKGQFSRPIVSAEMPVPLAK